MLVKLTTSSQLNEKQFASHNGLDYLSVTFLGSACEKASLKMLMKLTPGFDICELKMLQKRLVPRLLESHLRNGTDEISRS